MRNSAASGYTIPASQLTPILPLDAQEQFKAAIANDDLETLANLFYDNAPDDFPTYVDFFKLTPEDESDHLDHDTIYLEFQVEDLYETIPKPGLKFLTQNKIEPAFSRWTIYL